MKPIGCHNYFVYIITNIKKNVLYIGVTNNLKKRLYEHYRDSIEEKLHFAGKYNCVYLIYWERFIYVEHAINREKELKGWSRKKKEDLINEFNVEWKFLNEDI